MRTLMIVFGLLLTSLAYGQEKKPQIVIQTSAECGQCKDRVEEKLNYTSGIIFAELDVPTKQLTVKYKANKITADEIRKILSDLGYDADDVKADPEAVAKLPLCCQPGGMDGHDH